MKTSGVKKWVLSCLFLASTMAVNAGGFDEISEAIKNGNAKFLASHFEGSVELTIVEEEDSYRPNQAEMVLKDFFVKNAPKSFNLVHKGSSPQGLKYGIGTLNTQNGTFRTSIFFKPVGSGYVIQEIRFEKE